MIGAISVRNSAMNVYQIALCDLFRLEGAAKVCKAQELLSDCFQFGEQLSLSLNTLTINHVTAFADATGGGLMWTGNTQYTTNPPRLLLDHAAEVFLKHALVFTERSAARGRNAMFGRLFPKEFDNAYRGHWLALVILGLLLFLRLAQTGIGLVDPVLVIRGPDGILFDTFNAPAQAAFTYVFRLLCFLNILVCLIGVLAFVLIIRFPGTIPNTSTQIIATATLVIGYIHPAPILSHSQVVTILHQISNVLTSSTPPNATAWPLILTSQQTEDSNDYGENNATRNRLYGNDSCRFRATQRWTAGSPRGLRTLQLARIGRQLEFQSLA
jgi:hypothetical protein